MSGLNEEQLFERRHRFLTMRLAGATFSVIARKYNEQQLEAAMQAGRDPETADQVSTTTVRKDVARAKEELITDATRDALRGEHRAILLDMRRANYAAMAAGDIDAAKVVMSTLQREAEMFGLDDPKRSVVGIGTDVEFATDLVGLIQAVGYTPPDDLMFAAHGERSDRDRPALAAVVDAEVVPLDPDAPEPRAAGGVASGGERAGGDGTPPADTDPAPAADPQFDVPSPPAPGGDDPWSNL